MTIEVAKYLDMPSTRPCQYCLSLQGGGVFADFDVGIDGRVFLVRISFDGYGCCRLEDTPRKMDEAESKQFIEWVESDNVNHDAMSALLNDYFDRNKDLIWQDSLTNHGLLQAKTIE